MPREKSAYLAQQHNRFTFRYDDIDGTQPTQFYLAIFTAAPDDDLEGTEASYAGYARIIIPRGSVQWEANGTNRVQNRLQKTFPIERGE